MIPVLSTDLIKELDATYPHRCLTRLETVREAAYMAGKRELIDELLARLKADEEDSDDALPRIFNLLEGE